MRKILTLGTAIALTIGFGLPPANAGLLGMPLNLRAVIDSANATMAVASPGPACQRYTDDVFIGLVALNDC